MITSGLKSTGCRWVLCPSAELSYCFRLETYWSCEWASLAPSGNCVSRVSHHPCVPFPEALPSSCKPSLNVIIIVIHPGISQCHLLGKAFIHSSWQSVILSGISPWPLLPRCSGSFNFPSPYTVALPDSWLHLWFFLPQPHSHLWSTRVQKQEMENSRNKQLRSFNLYGILSSVMKSFL